MTPIVLPASWVPGEEFAVPAAFLHALGGGGDVARQGHQHRNRMLGRAGRVAGRGVHHDDPLPSGGRQVDVVDADAGPHDHLEPLLPFEQFGGELRGRANDDAVRLVESFADLFGRQAGADVDLDAGLFAQQLQPCGGKVVGNQNAVHRKLVAGVGVQPSGCSHSIDDPCAVASPPMLTIISLARTVQSTSQ